MKRITILTFVLFATFFFALISDYTPQPLYIDLKGMILTGSQNAPVRLVVYMNESTRESSLFKETLLPQIQERFIDSGAVLYAESTITSEKITIYINGIRYEGSLNYEGIEYAIYKALVTVNNGMFC